MYAVVRTGGKQYKVSPGDVIRVEKLDHQLGSEVSLTEVLLVGGEQVVVGQPTVADAKVTVVVTRQAKDRKVIIFKKKRRQGYRRLKGHRQMFTELFVKSISLNGKITKTDQEARIVDEVARREERQKAKAPRAEGEAPARKTAKKASAPKKTVKKKAASAKTKKTAAQKAKKTKA